MRTLALGLRAGAVIGEHSHAWGQLVFAAAGVMRVVTNEMAWLTPPTRAIWVPARVRHRIEMASAVSMRTLYIGAERAAPLPSEPVVLAVAPLLRELILHILALGMLAPDQPPQARLAGLLVDLLLAAGREDLALPLPRDARALKLALHWQRQPDDARGMAQLSHEVGASVRTLQRIFPQETGMTAEAWRQKARLLHAVARLSAGDGVAGAALASGYRSLAAFGVAFQRQFGVTPGRYMA